jgi:hypothetical protein
MNYPPFVRKCEPNRGSTQQRVGWCSGVSFVLGWLPRELWSIFRRYRHLLHDLPVLGAGVIQQWIRIKYGASVLVMVVPHTFGGDLKFNSHLHILISAGGFDQSSGRWIPNLRLKKGALMRNRTRRAVRGSVHSLTGCVSRPRKIGP